jgi:asparagine synthase (glutamine-hydrolysing)
MDRILGVLGLPDGLDASRAADPVTAGGFRRGLHRGEDWHCTAEGSYGTFEDDGVVVCVAGFPGSDSVEGEHLVHVAGLYRQRGVSALGALGGSYAVAVVDKRERRVHLQTDEYGSHSLYYAREATNWHWGTRLQDVASAVPHLTLNRAGLVEALCFRILTDAETMLREIRQVRPGTLVSLKAGSEPEELPTPRLAGRFSRVIAESVASRLERFELALSDCLARVRRRSPAVTVFLSGGLDSSLLLAKTLEAGFSKVRCCTAVFPGWHNPELPGARRVAARLGVPLDELEVSHEDVERLFPCAVAAMEEPPRHYKIFALWKMYEYASNNAPMVLSGIGAENVFGPKVVTSIRTAQRRLAQLGLMPMFARRTLARGLTRAAHGKLAVLRNLSLCADERALFTLLLLCDERLPQVRFANGIPDVPEFPLSFWESQVAGLARMEDRQQVFALLTEDRSDMQARIRVGGEFGVQTVHPFLESEVMEVGTSQPIHERQRDGWSKPLLRLAAEKYFPKDWIYTHKFGFPTPLADWIAGPLRRWLTELDEATPVRRDVWRADELRQAKLDGNLEVLWSAMTAEFLLKRYLG